jgi:hypothetical protein
MEVRWLTPDILHFFFNKSADMNKSAKPFDTQPHYSTNQEQEEPQPGY